MSFSETLNTSIDGLEQDISNLHAEVIELTSKLEGCDCNCEGCTDAHGEHPEDEDRLTEKEAILSEKRAELKRLKVYRDQTEKVAT